METDEFSMEEYKALQKLVKKTGKKVEDLLPSKDSDHDSDEDSDEDSNLKHESKKHKHRNELKDDNPSADHLVERLKIEAEIVELVKKKDYSKKDLKKKLLEKFSEEDVEAVFEEVF